jgi:CRISPR-associated protein (TIGR02710 family)
MTPRPAILVCTVGGSTEPIITAIRTVRPVHIAFLCTAKAAEAPGSEDQVASILDACAPSNASHEIRIVAADDPDAAFVVARETLQDLHRRFPDAELRVDYTGGTKSMTAALMLAATATPETGAVVQFMAGQRKDLVRIVGGTERPVRMTLEAVLAHRALERARDVWRSFGWAEALLILPPTTAGLPAPLAREIEELRAASELFAAWDRFEHARALDHLDAAALPPLERWRPALRRLASAAPHEREPLALWDLWLNAQRRAARGQHDDAVARAYRLVEWSAQYVLRTELGIRTGGVTRAEIGDALFDHLDRGAGRDSLKLGLEQALDVIRIKLPDHPLTAMLGPKSLPVGGKSPKGRATPYLTALVDPSQGWKERRNRSILAHGDRPVGEDVWRTAAAWCREKWIPWLQEELRRHGQALAQLPDHWPLA